MSRIFYIVNSGHEEGGHNALFVTARTYITGKAAIGVATAHHSFDDFLDVGPLVSRDRVLVIFPPPLPMVDEYLTKAVGAVFRRGMKQQEMLLCLWQWSAFADRRH